MCAKNPALVSGDRPPACQSARRAPSTYLTATGWPPPAFSKPAGGADELMAAASSPPAVFSQQGASQHLLGGDGLIAGLGVEQNVAVAAQVRARRPAEVEVDKTDRPLPLVVALRLLWQQRKIRLIVDCLRLFEKESF